MSLNLIGLIIVLIGLYISIKETNTSLFIYFFVTSILTTSAVLTVGDNSITVPHFMALIFCIRVIYDLYNKKLVLYNLPKSVSTYILYCVGVSIIGAIIFVIPNKIDALKHTSIVSIIIQLIYLIMSVITLWCVLILIRNKKIGISSFDKALNFASILMFILAIFQIINIELFNKVFVTREGQAIIQYLASGKIRITTTFNEPSMLAVFLILAMTYHVFKACINYSDNKDSLYYITGYIIVGFLSRGSTFILALGIISIIVLLFIYKSLDKKKFYYIIAGCTIVVVIVNFIGNNIILSEVMNLINKVLGHGVSGSERLSSLINMIKLSFRSILIGFGYGAIRGNDLFSTLLVNTGVIGLGLFIKLIYDSTKFNDIKNENKTGIKAAIILNIIMMFISVPEPYFAFMWIFVAFGLESDEYSDII